MISRRTKDALISSREAACSAGSKLTAKVRTGGLGRPARAWPQRYTNRATPAVIIAPRDGGAFEDLVTHPVV